MFHNNMLISIQNKRERPVTNYTNYKIPEQVRTKNARLWVKKPQHDLLINKRESAVPLEVKHVLRNYRAY